MRNRVRKERKVFEDVEIVDTANEGLAIGKAQDGRIVLVRYGVPGDIATVEVVEKRKGMFITRPLAYKQFSTWRTEPFCSHFGVCGGCKWQHMSYEGQLHFKEKTVKDAFERIGKVDPARIQPILGAPDQQYYRNKLEYTASEIRWLSPEEFRDKDTVTEFNGVGFHLPGSFDKVLDVQHCYLQSDRSNAIRLFVKQFCIDHQWPFSNLKNKTGFLRNIIVRTNLKGDAMVVLIVGEDKRDWIDALVDALRKNFSDIVSLYSCVNTKVNDSIHDLEAIHEYGERSLIETLGHVRFHIGPKSFFQTNSRQAAALYERTKQIAQLRPTDHVYDLYCGVGSLGIYMADACQRVVGIELISEAIDDAKENARLNEITNTHFETGKVELLLDPDFIRRHGAPDVVITDPPRAGMHPDVIRHLMTAAPDRIVYVSCNPSTQARDIQMLSEMYELQTALPVDMFPHTHHIECIALLTRK